MSSDSAIFTCNICGSECTRPPEGMARDLRSCEACGSSVRLRALIALLSNEMFGVPLTLPEFPVLKSVRGIGMSDSPDLAARLSEKFDYTNTFYHQAPFFDVTQPDPRDEGRYDFILSSEVMEHVPPPVERSFAVLHRMLKQNALLIMTTPYTLDGKTVEHFPELHEYALASPGGHIVLVNRRRDGSLETFDNLVFHGGPGSTLEMRVFSETSLRCLLEQAGFSSIHVATENSPEFGVQHAETWSLPIAARKGHFQAPSLEMAIAYRNARQLIVNLERQLAALQGEYERFVAFHNQSHHDEKQALAERTEWALNLEREKNEHQSSAAALHRQLQEARSAMAALEQQFWVKVGRKVGTVD